MILTYKIKHNKDFSKELAQAYIVAEYGRVHKIRLPYAKDINSVRGCLPYDIVGQIIRKYGSQQKIKKVNSVTLIVPNFDIKLHDETNSIWIPCLKLHLENTIPYKFTKINQAEIDNEFVYFACTIQEQPEMIPQSFIGVDRNTTGHIVVTANPDTGVVRKFGKKAIYIHTKYKNIREKLQCHGNHRKVKHMRNRESRIIRDLNHKISREIVDMAKIQNAALVFEDLSGIKNAKKRQNKSFRYSLHSWSFFQLQQFVEYKAKLLGISVLYVNPAYTSQDCSKCGSRGNRMGKQFVCPICGHANHADVNAAFNIALRQQDMIARMQTKMYTMGTLISQNDALLEGE